MSWEFWARLALVVLGWAAIPGGSRAEDQPEAGAPGAPAAITSSNACEACGSEGRRSFRVLDEARVDSLGRALSNHNVRAILRTDSLYRAGVFGRPDTETATAGALIHFQLHSWSALKYIADLGTDQERIARVEGEAPLRPFARKFLSSAVYPLRFLDHALIGGGGFCLEYLIPGQYDEKVVEGGTELRIRRAQVDLPRRSGVAVLSREMPTTNAKVIELLYESRFCGRVALDRVIDRGDTLEVLALYDLEGVHVRKWGTNRLAAIIEWRSALRDGHLPENPRFGACAYFPGISLKLPFILPDLGLADLRDFSYPPPFLSAQWQQQLGRELPQWLRVRPGGIWERWESNGPRPQILSERFPER